LNRSKQFREKLKQFREKLKRFQQKTLAWFRAKLLFRNVEFLKLWSAETFSVFGVQFSGLAIPWIAAITLGVTSIEMGVLVALGTVPFLAFGLFVGVWVDRNRRRPIMIISDIARALSLASIPVSVLLIGPNLIVLYLATFSVGTFTVFDDVSSYAFVPSLVETEDLIEANSTMETSRASAQVAGPSLAGILIQLLTAPFAILLDVIGYVGSAISLSRIKKEESLGKRKQENSVIKDIKEGLAVVFNDRNLWSIAGSTGTSNFFSSAIGALFILFVTKELGIKSSFILGIIFTLGAIGALFGALLASKIANRLGVGRTIVLSMFVGGASWIALYFANSWFEFSLLILSMFVGSAGSVIYNVNQVSFRQAIVPVELQGRLNATMRFLVWGTIPVGGIVGGILGEIVGLRTGIGICAVGATLAFLWVLLSPVRKITEIPRRNS
jgi:MFS family permease